MALPVLTQHLAQTKLAAYCAQKIPADIRDRVRLDVELEGEKLTLIESRPHIRNHETWTHLPVAQFRYNQGSSTWSLYCPHLGNPEVWRPYPAKPQHDLGQLIKLLDEDETGAFWG